jgi:hypothetical protein
MERTWCNNYDMINDMKDMETFNQITKLTIRGNTKFTHPFRYMN